MKQTLYPLRIHENISQSTMEILLIQAKYAACSEGDTSKELSAEYAKAPLIESIYTSRQGVK